MSAAGIIGLGFVASLIAGLGGVRFVRHRGKSPHLATGSLLGGFAIMMFPDATRG